MFYVFIKCLPVKRYWYWQKFDCPGEPWSPWAYFLILFVRSQQTDIICSICLTKIFITKELLISTFIDTKSTFQASQEACGPISWYRSIGVDKLHNFCPICLDKIFTWKTLLPLRNIDKNRLYRRAMRTGSLFLYIIW